ncbi:hypothetical protein RRG08_022652 [Elysia crispata]|uniref:Uncharacterized protein n=1 Tax=Elysia crispata TaxID=231223 RepID=A0AAE1D8J9_9GAST|nr:hypothetical protein RRG08_022652 [Elysia crispata]
MQAVGKITTVDSVSFVYQELVCPTPSPLYPYQTWYLTELGGTKVQLPERSVTSSTASGAPGNLWHKNPRSSEPRWGLGSNQAPILAAFRPALLEVLDSRIQSEPRDYPTRPFLQTICQTRIKTSCNLHIITSNSDSDSLQSQPVRKDFDGFVEMAAALSQSPACFIKL